MIKCIAIDDEPLALDLLEDFIGRVPFLTLAKRCCSAFEAMDVLQKENIDLVFLDIEMPDVSGIQLLKSLGKKPMVIFTTAYSGYAAEGFDLDATDYLLKPFSFERFLKAASKAKWHIEGSAQAKATPETQPPERQDYIFIKSGYDTVKLPFDDILYVEGMKDYVKIHTVKENILSLISMKALLKQLPEEGFVRIHRSYIVAVDKIELVQKRKVTINEKKLPVGDTYRKKFFDFISRK